MKIKYPEEETKLNLTGISGEYRQHNRLACKQCKVYVIYWLTFCTHMLLFWLDFLFSTISLSLSLSFWRARAHTHTHTHTQTRARASAQQTTFFFQYKYKSTDSYLRLLIFNHKKSKTFVPRFGKSYYQVKSKQTKNKPSTHTHTQKQQPGTGGLGVGGSLTHLFRFYLSTVGWRTSVGFTYPRENDAPLWVLPTLGGINHLCGFYLPTMG